MAAKILIAEDDPFLANAYKLKLTKAGFDIRLASDGKEAIEALGEFKPDLIILDIIMPIQDGFATLNMLKANEEWKNIPVIIASNLGQKEDKEKSLQMGASLYVVKSDLDLNDLIKNINRILAS